MTSRENSLAQTSQTSLPPETPVGDAVRQMALAAWDKFSPSCAWFMPKTDFATVRKIETFLCAMRKNGGMEAWSAARNIEKSLPSTLCH
jgi:hypothetical protein